MENHNLSKSEIYYINKNQKPIACKKCKYCNKIINLYITRDIIRKNFCSRHCSIKFEAHILMDKATKTREIKAITNSLCNSYVKRNPKTLKKYKECKICNKKISYDSKNELCREHFNKTKIIKVDLKNDDHIVVENDISYVEFHCQQCNQISRKKIYRYGNEKYHCCSWSCYTQLPNKEKPYSKITKDCPNCGKKISKFPSLFSGKRSFCSRRCSSIFNHKTGKESIFYIDGRTPFRKILKGSDQYNIWRLKVYKKYNYKCIKCESNKNIHAHHKIKFSIILKNFLSINKNLDIEKDKYQLLNLAFNFLPFWDINNGEVLCQKCHQNEHPEVNLNKKNKNYHALTKTT